MKQKRTNHPHSIENAALEAVTEWWDSCFKPNSEKVKIIANCVEKIGKANLVSSIKEKLLQEPSNGQHADSSQSDGNNNNDERELNSNDGSEILEPSNGQQGNSTHTDSNDDIDERDLNGNNESEILEQWSAERNEDGEQTDMKEVDGSFQNGHNLKEFSAHAAFVPTIKRKFDEENTFETTSKYGRLSVCSEEQTM